MKIFIKTSFRRALIEKIENLSKYLVRQVSQNVAPSISYMEGRNWGWCKNESEESSDMDAREEVSLCQKTLNFTGVDNRQRFALVLAIVAFVHEKLTHHSKNMTDKHFYCTRRSYYYELKNRLVGKFVEKQQHVDNAINQICMVLDCGPWEIGETFVLSFFIIKSLTQNYKFILKFDLDLRFKFLFLQCFEKFWQAHIVKNTDKIL